MRGPKDLLAAEDNWVTELGASFPGERVVVRGKDLFSEFSGEPWQKLLLFMITGRMYSGNELKVLEQVWTLTSNYPDPRIWNNRVAALAGTSKSTAHLGVAAAVAVTEAEIYGGQPLLHAVNFILEAGQGVEKGQELSRFVKTYLREHRAIGGYGRPIVRTDERIEPFKVVIEEADLQNGKHVQLAYEIEQILLSGRWRMQMNIAGLVAALVADLGFSAREFYLWLVNGFSAGALACFVDASDKQEGTFFPVGCNRINYTGSTDRTWD